MAHANRKKALLKKHGLKGVNKPKRTPKHPKKSHVVLAQEGHQLKLIRLVNKEFQVQVKILSLQKIKLDVNLLKQGTQRILKRERCQQPIGRIKPNGKCSMCSSRLCKFIT